MKTEAEFRDALKEGDPNLLRLEKKDNKYKREIAQLETQLSNQAEVREALEDSFRSSLSNIRETKLNKN